MAAKKLSGRELSRLVDVKPQTVSSWQTRGVSASHVIEVSRILGVKPETISPHFAGASVTSGGQVVVTDTNEKVTTAEVIDSAMTPEIPRGDEVVIDQMREPRPGDYVGAMYKGEVIVRKYSMAGGTPALLPLDSATYPTIGADFIVLGVVVRHHRILLR